MDSQTAKDTQDVIRQLSKKKLKDDKAVEMGLKRDETQEVPEALPKFIFLILSNFLGCPKAMLTDTEASVMTESLSALMPKMDNKAYHALVVISVTMYKISACQEAIKNKMAGMSFKLPFGAGKKAQYDEKTQSVKVAA